MGYEYPPVNGGERETLGAYLDYYRAIMIDKVGGLTREQAGTRLIPSTLTLIGLVYHLGLVENWWFGQFFSGLEPIEPWASADWKADGDWEMTVATELEPELVIERYREALEIRMVYWQNAIRWNSFLRRNVTESIARCGGSWYT